MQRNGSALGGSATSLEVRYTGKPVSGWGGLVAVMRYLEKRGVRQVLAQALPDGRTSPNQIPVLDIALALLATVLTGGRRFAHLERLRSDEVVQAIVGVARMPSAMTLTRYFGGLVRSQIEHLSEVLSQFGLRRLRAPALDLDSTVFERYGHQQGSLKGYNPRQTRASLPSSTAGDVGRSQARAARLVAQRQYRQRAWRHRLFGRDPGQVAGRFSALRVARGFGLFRH